MNAPPIGICSNCRDYTRDAQQINQQCPACKTGFTFLVVEEKTGYYAPAVQALELPNPGRWRSVIFAAALVGPQPTLLETVDDKRSCRNDVSS
jgi:hypothetical protein